MAREIAESDHPAASERNELCEFNSDVQLRCASHADEFPKSQDSLPEIPTIIHSHCEVNVGLEALASLTSSSVPAKHLHQCEPFNLWIELSDPRVEIVAVPSVNTALEDHDVVLRHARAVSPTPSGSRPREGSPGRHSLAHPRNGARPSPCGMAGSRRGRAASERGACAPAPRAPREAS